QGTTLRLPAPGSAPAAQAVAPASAQAAPEAMGAYKVRPGDTLSGLASAARLSAGQVGTLAAQSGAPSSLAAAIAWQESGFNNAMISPANARGVMQVMPGTWSWVQANLSSARLDPSSPTDNVKAGSLYLAHLLRETNGDPSLAAAGYYQGLASVRRIGMLPETRRYVANVLALRGRFGG